jgi:hypothetical protein
LNEDTFEETFSFVDSDERLWWQLLAILLISITTLLLHLVRYEIFQDIPLQNLKDATELAFKIRLIN